MEIIAKRWPFSAFVDEFVSHFALLYLNSNHLVLSFLKHRVESNDCSNRESFDALGSGRRILKKSVLAR